MMTEDKLILSSLNSSCKNNHQGSEDKGLVVLGLNKSNLISTNNNDKKLSEKSKHMEMKNKKLSEREEIILIDKENENVKNMLIKLKSFKIRNDKISIGGGADKDHGIKDNYGKSKKL